MVTVNGKELDVAGMILSDFLDKEHYKPVRVVVEINEEIIPREDYSDISLADGDIVEVVSFMGGGAYTTQSNPKTLRKPLKGEITNV